LGVVVSNVMDFVVPDTLAELERALDCDSFVGCADEWSGEARIREPRVVELYDFKGFGRRVVGICAPRWKKFSELETEITMAGLEEAAPKPPEPAVTVTKNSREATAKAGKKVHYQITVKNSGDTDLTLIVVDSGITGEITLDKKLALKPGETKEYGYEDTLPDPLDASEVTNTVSVTGSDADGRPVSATATHKIAIRS
jgi:hypothetical protein